MLRVHVAAVASALQQGTPYLVGGPVGGPVGDHVEKPMGDHVGNHRGALSGTPWGTLCETLWVTVCGGPDREMCCGGAISIARRGTRRCNERQRKRKSNNKCLGLLVFPGHEK